jgi:hypothetical protein
MHEEPESNLLEIISNILSANDAPSEVKAGAIRFVELYAVWQPQPIVRNTSVDMINALLLVIADGAETAAMRVWAAEALATLVYQVGGEYSADAMQPETLANVVANTDDLAVSQSANNVLMMTYYMTVTHRSCDFRGAEVDGLERALLSVGDRNDANNVQALATSSDGANQTRTEAAFSNVMDIVHPNGQDTCAARQSRTASAYFIDHVRSRQQASLFEQLVDWASTSL